MVRHRSLWFAIALLLLASLACNAFAGTREPGVLPPPVIGETPVNGTEIPGVASTATLPGDETPGVGTPTGAMVTMLVDLNVRSGPGVQYERVGFLLEGTEMAILGRDPASGWWRIECPPEVEDTECWVSGGAQFTTAHNTADVPVVATPPLPMPVPPEPAAGTGLLVYSSDGRLFAVTLDLTQDPPQPGQPVALGDATNVEAPLIAGDGRRVAYKAGPIEANELQTINSDGRDQRVLVAAGDIPVAAAGDTSGVAVTIGQVQWLADHQTLAFNTNVINLVGPGAGSQEDLWTVALDGEATERLAAGAGGGAFAVSPGNRVVASLPQSVVRVNLDGGDRQTVVNFDFINTASEYIYYPQPQWTADGSQALVAIPSADPWVATAAAALWRIPASGAAQQLGRVTGNILFNPVRWSPDGANVAYVQQVMDPTNPPPVLAAGGAGAQNLVAYERRAGLAAFAWNQTGSHFLYGADSLLAIGQPGAPPVEMALPAGHTVLNAQWLTPSAFVAAVGAPGTETWTLVTGNLLGNTTPVGTMRGVGARFDVWGR